MNHGWERKRTVDLGHYTRDEVEDFTGFIPLFLEKCMVGGKIDLASEFFTKIDSQVAAFEEKIQRKYEHNLGSLTRYAIAVPLT